MAEIKKGVKKGFQAGSRHSQRSKRQMSRVKTHHGAYAVIKQLVDRVDKAIGKGA